MVKNNIAIAQSRSNTDVGKRKGICISYNKMTMYKMLGFICIEPGTSYNKLFCDLY